MHDKCVNKYLRIAIMVIIYSQPYDKERFHMDKYVITLAGGGSKGIYEIGAWKALKELGIE